MCLRVRKCCSTKRTTKKKITKAESVKDIDSDNDINPIDAATLDREDIVMLLQGKNNNGEQVFSYIKLSISQLRALKDRILSRQTFEPSDFGTVLASGYGYPSPELRAEMHIKYDI